LSVLCGFGLSYIYYQIQLYLSKRFIFWSFKSEHPNMIFRKVPYFFSKEMNTAKIGIM
jgi:hypothetical protein